jgi:hypothetical protein
MMTYVAQESRKNIKDLIEEYYNFELDVSGCQHDWEKLKSCLYGLLQKNSPELIYRGDK